MNAAALVSQLGPFCTEPSAAAKAAIRKAVMRSRDQYPKTGMQSAPRCLDGADPYAFALAKGIVTLDEVRPFLLRWRDEESLNRGLGTGKPGAKQPWTDPYTGEAWPKNTAGDDVPVTVHDCQHETMQQYLTNSAALEDDVARQAPRDLVAAIAAEPLVTSAKITTTNPREHGRAIRALLQEGSDAAVVAAAKIIAKVQQQMGNEGGLHYYMLAPLKGDHANMPVNPQQQSTILGAAALAYRTWPTWALQQMIVHGLTMLAECQTADGSFLNDAAPDDDDADSDIESSDPGKVMDLWIIPHVIAAKWALGPLWPGKAQKILDRARALWLATDYTRPGNSSFGKHNVLSITIACAAEYGWRA